MSSLQYQSESQMTTSQLLENLYDNPLKGTYCRDSVLRIIRYFEHDLDKAYRELDIAWHELERADDD